MGELLIALISFLTVSVIHIRFDSSRNYKHSNLLEVASLIKVIHKLSFTQFSIQVSIVAIPIGCNCRFFIAQYTSDIQPSYN